MPEGPTIELTGIATIGPVLRRFRGKSLTQIADKGVRLDALRRDCSRHPVARGVDVVCHPMAPSSAPSCWSLLERPLPHGPQCGAFGAPLPTHHTHFCPLTRR